MSEVRTPRVAGQPILALINAWPVRHEHIWNAAFLGEQHGRPARERIPPILIRDGDSDAFLRWLDRHQPSFHKDVLIAPTWVPGGTLREKSGC